jgi:hypothetical protein
VVAISAEEFGILVRGERSGQALVAAIQASPYHDVDLGRDWLRLPVRDVEM